MNLTPFFLKRESVWQKNFFVLTFFVIVFLLGVSTYRDYGISWDERVERIDGAVALRYIEDKTGRVIPGLDSMFKKQGYEASIELHSYKDRYYPVGFNLPVEATIHFLGIEDERAAYFFRHLITFGICLLGVLGIYLLAARRFSDWRLGLLTAAMYALSPRLYGEWFYNSKDLVLLSIATYVMYTALTFLQKPSFKNAVLLAFSSALAMNIRLMAIVLPLLTMGFLVVQVFHRRITVIRALGYAVICWMLIATLLVIAWPLLWESPLSELFDSLRFMAKYHFYQDILYFGQIIPSTQLPWHYLPVWVLITTPVVYLVLWLFGLNSIVLDLYRAKWNLWTNDIQMQDLFFLALFAGPILGFMILRPVIYDGWRHFYFIYPAFLMVAVRGYSAVLASPKIKDFFKRVVSYLLAFSFIGTAAWMVWSHPLQNVYFNALIGSNWISKFDVDYWGLSNRQALEYILSKDSRKEIYIIDGAHNFIPLSLSMLGKADADRLAFTRDPDQADYLITNYRLNSTDYAALPSQWQLFKHIHAGGELVSSVYKAKRLIFAPEVNLGETISFGSGGFGQYFLQSGDWALPEVWGVWAQSDKAYLNLPIPQHSKEMPNEIDLNLRALISLGHQVQKISIRLNDGPPNFFTLKMAENNQIKLQLPIQKNLYSQEMSLPTSLKVEIDSYSQVAPSTLGMGDDHRLLSIGLISATIK